MTCHSGALQSRDVSASEQGLYSTPNQVVAYNLRRARALRGLSLEATAAALAPLVGGRWTRQNINQLERAAGGGRERRFDADLLVALARVFDVPMTWFFLPPPHAEGIRVGEEKIETAALLDRLFNNGWVEVKDRLVELHPHQRPQDIGALAARLDVHLVRELSAWPGFADQMVQLGIELQHAFQFAQYALTEEENPRPLLHEEDDVKFPLPTTKTRGSPRTPPKSTESR